MQDLRPHLLNQNLHFNMISQVFYIHSLRNTSLDVFFLS